MRRIRDKEKDKEKEEKDDKGKDLRSGSGRSRRGSIRRNKRQPSTTLQHTHNAACQGQLLSRLTTTERQHALGPQDTSAATTICVRFRTLLSSIFLCAFAEQR